MGNLALNVRSSNLYLTLVRTLVGRNRCTATSADVGYTLRISVEDISSSDALDKRVTDVKKNYGGACDTHFSQARQQTQTPRQLSAMGSPPVGH